MKRTVFGLFLVAGALAQLGLPPGPGTTPPMPGPTPPGLGMPGQPGLPGAGGGVYQNPNLGLAFPIPPGFQLMGEGPNPQGGFVAVFVHPGGAELYAASRPLTGPIDLQGFHQMNLQTLAQQDQLVQQQGIQVQRQPLSGLSFGGRPALGVYSQVLYQGQAYLDLAVYTVEGNRAYAFQLTAPAQVFGQFQGALQALLSQVQILGGGIPGPSQVPFAPGPGPAPYPPGPAPSPYPPGDMPSPYPPGPQPPMPPFPGTPGGENPPPPPGLTAQPSPAPVQKPSLPGKPAFTPPANRTVELVYSKEVGDQKRLAVVLGGLRYRIAPKGQGRWEVRETVEDAEGKTEETYLLDGFGLEEGEEAILPPVWHTGRTEIGGRRFQKRTQGDLTVYRDQDGESLVEFAYRKDGWLAYLLYCDLTKKANPCVRYTLKEVR
ncbi:hypothetical protein [Thermus sp.]|uniref:hypothetical protein n=1 Tax=Thermus sp. TaxID=275 RepID=UPI00307F0A46